MLFDSHRHNTKVVQGTALAGAVTTLQASYKVPEKSDYHVVSYGVANLSCGNFLMWLIRICRLHGRSLKHTVLECQLSVKISLFQASDTMRLIALSFYSVAACIA